MIRISPVNSEETESPWKYDHNFHPYSKTKKQRPKSDFSHSLAGGWGGFIIPKQDDPEWKFQSYRGTNLAYDILCEPICSDNENKEGDNLSGNRVINLKILTTNIDIF